MLFNSFTFFVLFCIVLIGYPLAPAKYRHLFLLAVSLIFYMGWSVKYLLLILLSIITTYFCGLLLERQKEIKKKKYVLAGCMVINLAILFFFKYFNFFTSNIDMLLLAMGMQPTNTRFDVLLPVGISFYTFQALGYIIDVYRGDIQSEKSFTKYALFVSFFPQLVAGPIERSKNLLNQVQNLSNRKAYQFELVKSGLIMMIWGYFMKVVIADRVAVLVDYVYNSYWLYGSFALIVATVGFAIQIYCDFASYSTIAIGASKVLGFSLMENFNTPYFSCSIKEFWRRWHISLSTWFRDYLYIPLGGSRCSNLRNKLNLMIVFIVSGLWHGANWTYMAWGGLHGGYQIVGNLLEPLRKKIIKATNMNIDCFSYRFGRGIITFILVCFAWIFFRAETITDAWNIIVRMVTNIDLWSIFNGSIYDLGLARQEFNILIISMAILFIVDFVKYSSHKNLDEALFDQNLWFRWTVLIGLIMWIIIFGMYGPSFDAQAFIYFQF